MKKNNKNTSARIDPIQEQKNIQNRMLLIALCVVLLSVAVLFLWWRSAAKGVLMTATEENMEVVPGSEIERSEIRAITFQSDFSGETFDAWDISAAGDGSVMAWVTESTEAAGQYDLYIGAKGGVTANPDSSYWFSGYSSLQEIHFNGSFDTSNVTDMSYMFSGCTVLTGLDVSGFDTSNVTNMEYMFNNCYELASLDVSGFDTSNVMNMTGMFFNCLNLTDIDISGFDMEEAETESMTGADVEE